MRCFLVVLAFAALAPSAAAAPPTRAQIAARATELGLGAHAEQIARDALPGARLQAGGSAALGADRLGGRPDLPPGMPWPTCRGRKLTFMAQLWLPDVAALAPGSVPPAGALSVFADFPGLAEEEAFGPVGRRTCVIVRVLRGPLERRDVPRGVRRLHSRPVALRPTLTVPDYGIAEDRYGVTLDQLDTWDELESEAVTGTLAPSREFHPRHQVLGWPTPIQDTPLYGCGHAPLKRLEYKLLLQIDEDDKLGFTVGDAPTLYITGRPGDLREGRFGRLCAELQDD